MKKTGRRIVSKIELAHMLLDFPLAVEVQNSRLSMGAANRTVDAVLHTGLLGRISNRLALLNLTIITGLPEVLHGEDAVGAFEHPLHSRAILHIALHNLCALVG